MEDEEYVPGTESSGNERLTEEETSKVVGPVQKKTIKLKRFNSAGSAGSVTGALTNSTTGNSGQSLLAASQKRPLETAGANKSSSADCNLRTKVAKISDSPNKAVTTQN